MALQTSLKITPAEWRWLLLGSCFIVLLTSLPAMVAWQQTPEHLAYTGQVLSPADGNTYLNKMRQGFNGQWLFSIAYTAEPHQAAFLHPYYLWLGHLCRWLNLPLEAAFQLFRAVNSGLLLLVVYLFIAMLWPEPARRRLAFLFVAGTAGLGWLMIFFNQNTTDLKVPESITFTTMLTNPHFPLATTFMIISLMTGMLALHRRSWVYAGLCGLAQTVLIFLHPYDIVVTGLTLALYFLLGWQRHGWWSWRAATYLGVSGLICLPALWHNVNLYTLPGVWRLWQTQAPPPTPPPLAFVLGYGFLLVLAIIGGYRLLYSTAPGDQPAQILVLWAGGVFLLMFTPIPLLQAIQVRFSEGLHIPIALLAAQGVITIFPIRPPALIPPAKLWLPLLIFLSLSNGLVLASALWRVATPEAPWFYRRDEIAVMRWLETHRQPNEVVLSLNWSGNYLPAQANVHVYVGHLYETIAYQEKVERSQAFFDNRLSAAESRAFLEENGIDWVFVGQQEAATPFAPERYPYLSRTFTQGTSALYRVNLP
jgi:hypothetical protein